MHVSWRTSVKFLYASDRHSLILIACVVEVLSERNEGLGVRVSRRVDNVRAGGSVESVALTEKVGYLSVEFFGVVSDEYSFECWFHFLVLLVLIKVRLRN